MVLTFQAAALASTGATHESFLTAARAGDLFTLKQLYSSVASTDEERVALCTARAAGVSSVGHTAMHWVGAGGHVACLRWMLSLPEAPTTVAIANNGGSTPLHSAASNGHAACVEALLAAKADPTALDCTGDSPFACAAARGHEAAARLLASHAPPHAFLQLSIGGKRVGSLIFALDETAAPRACANFIGLCEGFRARSRVPGALYARDGSLAGATTSSFFGYRGTSFHRLLAGQLVQGGRMAAGDASIFGGQFADERNGLRVAQEQRGLLCMANSGADSNASQFYITFAPCPHLSGSHVCFGRLVFGDDVLSALEHVPPAVCSERPSAPITITASGKWPAPPAAHTATTHASEAVAATSLNEVGAAAETSRAAVASAVAEALEHSRKRRIDADDSAGDAPPRQNPRTTGGLARWDMLGGLAGGDAEDESSDECEPAGPEDQEAAHG